MKILGALIPALALVALGCSGGSSSADSSGGQTTGGAPQTKTAGGGSATSGVTEADLGVPLYPGATPEAGGDGEFKQVGSGHTTVGSTRDTKDSADKVVAFYKDKCPKLEAAKAEEMFTFTGTGTNGGEVTIGIKQVGDHTEITIGNVTSH